MVLYPNKLPESERVCSGICIVADAYGVPVVVLAMGADFLQRAAAVNLSVARDVEVVADVAEAAADVLAAAVVKAQAHAWGVAEQ